ncbi:nitroreductase family protein [Thermithiobacillus plumbiphilus]|uniref:Nitroreductase family protein n=1 Tax=Thermithiobacillus plumbiphilus TaxID=1729899 RepID=A0ABU9D5G8_9PROT
MWDFFATVRHRHSVRQYRQNTPVEAEKLHAILEMATAAPSAGDLQAYHIHVITDETCLQQLSQAAQQQEFIRQAPACLVFSTDPERSSREFGDRGRQLYAIQDATIAASYAQLAAVAAGLASAWVGYFDEKQVRSILDIPEALEPVAMLTLGYPSEIPEPSPRRPLGEMVSRY